MGKKQSKGVLLDVKLIDPHFIQQMPDDDLVVVNRVRINALVVELELSEARTAYSDLLKTIRTMKKKEAETKKLQMGARMRVGDVKRLFADIDALPGSSFAYPDD